MAPLPSYLHYGGDMYETYYAVLLIISGVLFGAGLHTAGLMLFDVIKPNERGWVKVVGRIFFVGGLIAATAAFHL